MVPHVHHEDAVDAVGGQARRGLGGADGAQVGELLVASAFMRAGAVAQALPNAAAKNAAGQQK